MKKFINKRVVYPGKSGEYTEMVDLPENSLGQYVLLTDVYKELELLLHRVQEEKRNASNPAPYQSESEYSFLSGKADGLEDVESDVRTMISKLKED